MAELISFNHSTIASSLDPARGASSGWFSDSPGERKAGPGPLYFQHCIEDAQGDVSLELIGDWKHLSQASWVAVV